MRTLEIRFGRECKMYTLWSIIINDRFCKETYIKNLSTNYEDAIKKAEDYSRGNCEVFVDAPEDLNDIVRGDDVLRFGKYKDKRISQITDIKYLNWLFKGCPKPDDLDGKWYPTKSQNDPIVVHTKEHMVTLGQAILYNDKIITLDHYEKLKQWEEKSELSDFVGEIGKRITFDNLIVDKVTSIMDYGYPIIIYRFLDKDGNFIITKKSSYLNTTKGDTIKIKGTVKDHTIYNKVKQTNLSRVTIL